MTAKQRSRPAEEPSSNQPESVRARAIRKTLRALAASPPRDPWQNARQVANKLASLVAEIRSEILDPTLGLQLVTEIFEADGDILSTCDDSSGILGSVFSFDVTDLLVHFAGQTEDTSALTALLVRLHAGNDYGLRDRVMDIAATILPETEIRSLIAECQTRHEHRSRTEDHTWSLAIECLAQQIRDPELFEKTRRESWGHLNSAAYVDIAMAYAEAGRDEEALARLREISLDERFYEDERDDLLTDVLERLGKREEALEAALRLFRRNRSLTQFTRAAGLAGAEREQELLQAEVVMILARQDFRPADAMFLVEAGKPESAEQHLVTHAAQIDGDHYGVLVPLAEALVHLQRPLGASLVYRALLDSILGRGRSRIYHHAVRYWQILHRLAPAVSNWAGLPDHEMYVKSVQTRHKAKSAFWGQVRSQPGQLSMDNGQ